MAILPASEILAETKILLNDANGILYTDDILIPILQKAYRELQQKMRKAGMSVTHEASGFIDVDANKDTLIEGSGLPNDLIFPIEIHSRRDSSEEWIELLKREWSPLDDTPSSTQLASGTWTWREEEIKLSPVNYDRQLLIRYHKELRKITSATTPIQVKGAETFLASRCGAITALVIGENETRSTILNADAKVGWDDFKSTRVKSGQSTPVRRVVNKYRAVQ